MGGFIFILLLVKVIFLILVSVVLIGNICLIVWNFLVLLLLVYWIKDLVIELDIGLNLLCIILSWSFFVDRGFIILIVILLLNRENGIVV